MKNNHISVYPYLFAIYPFLFLVSHNPGQINFYKDVYWSSLIIVLGISIFLHLLLSLVIKDVRKSGIIVTIFICLFFTYGHVESQTLKVELFILFLSLLFSLRLVQSRTTNGVATSSAFLLSASLTDFICVILFGWLLVSNNQLALILYSLDSAYNLEYVLWSSWLVLFISSTYFIITSQSTFHNSTFILNIIGAVLVAFPSFSIIYYEIVKDDLELTTIEDDHNTYSGVIVSNVSNKQPPDIYYIVLDQYGGRESLNKHLGFDNHEFIENMTDKGFYVASSSKSNYARTDLSLASSLNMEYINEYGQVGDGQNTSQVRALHRESDPGRFYRAIQHNKVGAILKSIGYRYINFSSGNAGTNYIPMADENYFYGGLRYENQALRALLGTTMLAPFYYSYFQPWEGSHRQRVLGTFEKLGKLKKTNTPMFVLAHIFCPHEPYIFGENGEEIIQESRMPLDLRKTFYLNQLISINKMTIALVNKLLSKSREPPIIVILSDHGTNFITNERIRLLGTNFITNERIRLLDASLVLPMSNGQLMPPSAELVNERLSNLIAVYLPLGGANLMYDKITNVNIFRLIFGYYFKLPFELIEDKSYYSYPPPGDLIFFEDFQS